MPADAGLGLALTSRILAAAGGIGAQGSLDARLLSWNPFDEGAKGDGLADDWEPVDRTLRKAAAAGGGIVYFPPGTYLLGQTLFGRSKVVLMGAGGELSILKQSIARAHVVDVSDLSGWGVQGLQINGNGLSVTSCLHAGGNATKGRLAQCVLTNTLGHAVLMDGTPTFNKIIDNEIRAPYTANGIYVVRAARGNGFHLIALNLVGQSTTGFGIIVEFNDFNTVGLNHVIGTASGSANDGIHLEKASHILVAVNLVDRWGAIGGGPSGISIANNAGGANANFNQFNDIIANILTRNPNWGISVADGTQFSNIIGNVCKNNQTAPVGGQESEIKLDTGTAAVVSFNQVTGNYCYSDAGGATKGIQVLAAAGNVQDNSIGPNTVAGASITAPVVDAGTRTRIQGSYGLQAPTEAVLVTGVDASLGNYVQVTLTAARLVGAPLNPTKNQRLVFSLIQGGAGAFAVTWNAVFKKTWSDAGNAAGARSAIAFTYDGTNWNQEGAQAAYV